MKGKSVDGVRRVRAAGYKQALRVPRNANGDLSKNFTG